MESFIPALELRAFIAFVDIYVQINSLFIIRLLHFILFRIVLIISFLVLSHFTFVQLLSIHYTILRINMIYIIFYIVLFVDIK